MLILSRKVNETIRIGDSVSVRVLSISEGHVKLGIDAPRDVTVYRSEIYDAVRKVNEEATHAAREAAKRIAGEIAKSQMSCGKSSIEQNVIQ